METADQMLATIKAHVNVWPEAWFEAIKPQIERWTAAIEAVKQARGRR